MKNKNKKKDWIGIPKSLSHERWYFSLVLPPGTSVFCQYLEKMLLVNAISGAEQHTFDVAVWPQTPVVEHGGSLWLNCSTSCQEADAKGDLETSLIKERRDNGTSWAAFQLVNITEWAPTPECSFSCFGAHKSVHANIIVYRK